jgi:hypothetical protein
VGEKMNDKKIIAEALLEIAKERSTTILLSETQYDDEIMLAAEKIGIVIPSPDFAVFETVYAEIDKPNKNGVILPRKAVEEGLPTLIGKQCNWEHEGVGQLCGYTISAKIDGDNVRTINVIWKSLFPEKMTVIEKKFKEKKFTVSFEIWSKDEEGNSVISENQDGTKIMNKIIFHGTGVLLNHQPACKNAIVYKLIASEKHENKIFDENLVYASLAIDNHLQKEEQKLDEMQKEEVIIPAVETPIIEGQDVPVEEAKKKTCKECTEELKDNEEEICAKCKEKKEKEEAKIEEPVKEEKIEEASQAEAIKTSESVEVAKLVRIIREHICLNETLFGESGEVNSEKSFERITRYFSDGTSSIEENDIQRVNLYTQAQLDEAIANAKQEVETVKNNELETIKADYETKLTALKDEKKNISTFEKAEEKPEGTQADLTVGDAAETIEDKNVATRKKVDEKLANMRKVNAKKGKK